MTGTGFQRLLDTHGPDPARWPARHRRAAGSLLARSAEAREALQEAETLAALLDAAGEPRRVPEVTEVVARATAHLQEGAAAAWEYGAWQVRSAGTGAAGVPAVRPYLSRRWRLRWPTFPLPFGWVPAGALAACLLLGLALGATLPPARAGVASTASPSDIIGLASDGPDYALGGGPVVQLGSGDEP